MEQSTTLDVPARGIEIPFPVVPEDAEEMLSHKEEFDYRNNREDFARWFLLKGKDLNEIEGYSEDTAKRSTYEN